jgi:hypothetical protein
MLSLRHRVIRPELLDDAPEPEALRNLHDLVRINDRLGGHGVLLRLLASQVTPVDHFNLLDVGAAIGDSARIVSGSYSGAQVFSLDRDFFHIASGTGPRVCADGFRLPIRDQAVDFVLYSLFLHHFTDEQIVRLMLEGSRVARRAVLVNDLERRFLPWCFLPATRWIFGWERINLHDGPISVAAGFRTGELARLAREAGFRQISEQVHRPSFRISLIASR